MLMDNVYGGRGIASYRLHIAPNDLVAVGQAQVLDISEPKHI